MESVNNDLSPQDAEKILSADFKNIVQKVKDGKTLSQAELARVQARAAKAKDVSSVWANNITELAKLLGATRQTINRWRKLDGAPNVRENGQHSVVEWRQFMRERGLEGANTGADMDALKARKLLAEIDDREIRNAIRKGEYVPVEDVRQAWSKCIGDTRAILEARLLNELPPILEGKTAIQIREEIQKVILETYTTLNNGGQLTP